MIAPKYLVNLSMGLCSYSNGEKKIPTSSSKAAQKGSGLQIRSTGPPVTVPKITDRLLDYLQCLRKRGFAQHRE